MKNTPNILFIALFLMVVGCTSQQKSASASDRPIAAVKQTQPSEDFVVEQLATDKSYGYSESNPVKVGGSGGGPRRERFFLSQLAGPNGERIEYQRLGSCCPFSTPNGFMGTGMLDKYEVMIEGEITSRILFINMYDFEPPLVPHGFRVKNKIN